jgi:hypothetical protein
MFFGSFWPTLDSFHGDCHVFASDDTGLFLLTTFGVAARQLTWLLWSSSSPATGAMLGIFRTRTLEISNCRHVLFRTVWNSQCAAGFGRRYLIPVQPTHLRAYSTKHEIAATKPRSPPRPSILSRFLPQSFTASESASSFGKIVALAKEEKKPLLMGLYSSIRVADYTTDGAGSAIGLLFVSSSVSMSVPLTVGKLIDFFSSANPVRPFVCHIFLSAHALEAISSRLIRLASVISSAGGIHCRCPGECWKSVAYAHGG